MLPDPPILCHQAYLPFHFIVKHFKLRCLSVRERNGWQHLREGGTERERQGGREAGSTENRKRKVWATR